MQADPVRLNSQLGVYTNFMNLLDLAAVAVPAGFTGAGLPFGVTLAGPAWSDFELLRLAARLQRCGAPRLGALPLPLGAAPDFDWASPIDGIAIAVCGAHLQGTAALKPPAASSAARGAAPNGRSRRRTIASMRGGSPGASPARPGLVRVDTHGAAIEVEVWSMPAAAFGGFCVAGIPAPLAIAQIQPPWPMAVTVCGFLCEALAVQRCASDITHIRRAGAAYQAARR